MDTFEQDFRPDFDQFALGDEPATPSGSPVPGDSQLPDEVNTILQADPALASLPEDDPRRNPSRQEFWQRQYSLEREKRLKAIEAAQANPLNELLKNPKVVERLLGVEPEPPKVEDQPPARPSRPERPGTYSREEALGDPNSASAKYEAALLKYNEDMAEYAGKVMDFQERKLRTVTEQQAQELEFGRRQREGAQILASRYGYTPEMISDFFSMINSGKSTMDDLVAAHQYRLLRAKQTRNPGGPTREELLERERRSQIPLPGGMAAAGARVADDMSKAFSVGLTSDAKRFKTMGER